MYKFQEFLFIPKEASDQSLKFARLALLSEFTEAEGIKVVYSEPYNINFITSVSGFNDTCNEAVYFASLK